MRLPGLPARLGFAWLAACKTLASVEPLAHETGAIEFALTAQQIVFDHFVTWVISWSIS